MKSEVKIDGQIRQLLDIFRRRWKMIASASLIGAVAIASLPVILGPRYTAKAQIVVDPQRAAGSEGSAIMSAMLDTAAIESHVAILTSESQIQQLLTNLLHNSVSELSNGAAGPVLDFSALDVVSLSRGFNAFKERQSRVIGITYTSGDPNLAAAVVNRAVNLYLVTQVSRNVANKGDTLKSLQERIPQARAELERAENAVLSYRVAVAQGAAKNSEFVDRQLADLNRELAEARSELARSETRLAKMQDLRRAHQSLTAAAETPEDQHLRAVSRQHEPLASALAREQVSPIDQRATPSTSRESTNEAINSSEGSANRHFSQVKADRDAAASRVSDISQRVVSLQEARNNLRGPEVQLQELQREAEAYRRLYDDIVLRQKATLEESEVRVLSLASVPTEPSSPKPILFALPGLILAAIGSSLIAVLLEQLDRGLRTEQDIADALNLRCVGVIPMLGRKRPPATLDRLSEAGAAIINYGSSFLGADTTPPAGHSDAKVSPPRSENLSSVQTDRTAYNGAMLSTVVSTLAIGTQQSEPRILLVTSSVPGEGKSSFAASFVAVAAELKRSVLLVDLDFTTPGSLASSARTAIGDGAKGQLELSAAAAITRVAGQSYDYLPLAEVLGDPILIFRDDQVARLLQQLRDRYALVVIDGGSLLGSSESRVIARLVDKVVLVVKWEATPCELAQNALKLLQNTGERQGEIDSDDMADNSVSAVITQVDLRRHAHYQQGSLGDSLTYARSRAAV